MHTATWLSDQEFESFLASCPEEKLRDSSHLADYIYTWMIYGNGAKLCSGDHGLLMSILALAAQRLMVIWHGDINGFRKSAGDKESRPPIEVVLDRQCHMCQAVFDPQFVKLLATYPQYMASYIADMGI
jgi:hypothetical protein